MDYEEYSKKILELQLEFENKKFELMKEFVRSNNPHKIGDKVTDSLGSIVIEQIGFAHGYVDKPCAKYFGIELKKDGTPKKKTSRRQVWQLNVI